MPIRGERGAPTFDQKQPNDLGRYFEQLETLFVRCQVQDDANKKKFTVSFVGSTVADSWEALPEYKDNTKTYVHFKECLFKIYNQVSLRYILSDLDRLVGKWQRLEMRSLQDLTDFHLRFNVVASYLLMNQLISICEQSQAYLPVFDNALQAQVTMRLQIKYPNHHPALPYTIEEIYDAAKWVLQGIPGTLSSHETSPSAPESGFVKPEQLGTFLNEFAKTLVDAMNMNSRGRTPASNNSTYASGGPRDQKCNFDRCNRFIHDCPGVDQAG